MIYYWGLTIRRRRMLRAVFAENMRLLGKETRRLTPKVRVRPVGLGLMMFVAILTLFDTPSRSIVRERISEDPPPSEYNLMLSESFVSLKKLFGLEIKTIMIDAGHGGEDPGAIGRMGTSEKDITIDIAKRLKNRLVAYRDYDIMLTRDSDATVSLRDRVDITNKSKADLFVSIHVNYIPRDSKEIIETYYFGPSDNNDTLELAVLENEGSDFSLSDYNAIIRKLNENMKLQESRVLASNIQKNLYDNMHSRNNKLLDFGVKRAPFVVLMGTEVPGVLVEVTCLSDRKEERRLKTEEYREEIAQYIEEGIINYLNTRSDS